MLGMALTFLVGVQLARSLGPAAYGRYGATMAVVSLLLVPAQMAAPILATREISVFATRSAFGDIKGVLAWFTLTVLASSALISGFGLAGGRIVFGADTDWARLRFWGLLVVPALALANLSVAFLRGLQHVTLSQTYEAIVRPALFAALLFVAIRFSGPFTAGRAMTMQALALALSVCLSAVHIWRLLPPETRRARIPEPDRRWIASAAPMTATEVIRTFESQYAMLLFGALAVKDVGLFRVALSTAGFVAIPYSIVALVVAPFLARLHANDDRRRLQLATSGAALAMFVSTAAATAAVLLAGQRPLIFAFGADYAGSWVPLALISCAYTITGFFGPTAILLNMCGQERAVTRAYALGALVGVTLTGACYPWLGIDAAGVAMIVAELAKGTLMRKAAINRVSVDASAAPLVRAAGEFVLRSIAEMQVAHPMAKAAPPRSDR